MSEKWNEFKIHEWKKNDWLKVINWYFIYEFKI